MLNKIKTTKVRELDKVWLSNKEACAYLGVPPVTMKRLRATASVRFYKVGRLVFYSKSELDEMVEKGKVW